MRGLLLAARRWLRQRDDGEAALSVIVVCLVVVLLIG